MNFMYKVAQFFQGRYGIDKFCYFLIILYCALCFANIFVRSFVITLIAVIIAVYAIFRVLSRNISTRQKEAEIFEGIYYKIKYFFMNIAQRMSQLRVYCFHKCPHCKAKLRLPRKKGKHTVCCPRCNKDFKMRVLF